MEELEDRCIQSDCSSYSKSEVSMTPDKSYNERTKPRTYRVNENNLGEDLAGIIPIPLKLADRDMQWS